MTPSARADKVVVRRRIPATREELFDAWTDPESMRQWMCPGDVVSADVQMDPRVGGSFLILMRSPTQVHEHRGEFTVVERPSKLVFTWSANATDPHLSLVTVEFFQVSANESDLQLTHEGLPGKDVADRYQAGWGKIVTHLEEHLRRKA